MKQASLILPVGNYRFASDIRGTLFFSNEENHCEVPGCASATIGIPGGYDYDEITIDYTYDSLHRLTQADYSHGDFFNYVYDPVGNRLNQYTYISSLSSQFDYAYDDANRLTEVSGVDYTWDDNGNLLDDGVNTYEYDSANRPTTVDDGNNGGAEYTYNVSLGSSLLNLKSKSPL